MKAAITDNGHFNHAAVPVINVHSDHDSRYPPLTNDVNMVNENGKSTVSDSGFLMNSLSDFIFGNTLFKTFIAKWKFNKISLVCQISVLLFIYDSDPTLQVLENGKKKAIIDKNPWNP